MDFSSLLKSLTSPRGYRITAIILFLILIFNAFFMLGENRIRSWDEARHGISAVEMMERGNVLVNTHCGAPDYWNVKPVLSFWNVIVGYQLFGPSIFGLRFVSALAFIALGAGTFFFLRKIAGRAAALTALLCLVVNPCNLTHTFRNGDPDGLFIMLIVFAVFALVISQTRRWYLVWCAVLLSLAFLTKSFHVGIIGIGIFIWVLWHWKHYRFSTVGAAVAAGILPILIWGTARYRYDGMTFFQSMVNLDLLGRVSQTEFSEHVFQPFYFYIKKMFRDLSFIPFLITYIGMALGFLLLGKRYLPTRLRNPFMLFNLLFFVMLTAVSASSAKLPWYSYPAFSILPLIAGIMVQSWMEGTPEALSQKWGNQLARFRPPWNHPGTVLTAFQLLIAVAVIGWGIGGEGKSIGSYFKEGRQTDVFESTRRESPFRGVLVYSLNKAGQPILPTPSAHLAAKHAGAIIKTGSVHEFLTDAKAVWVVVCTGDKITPDQAKEFAAKHQLEVVRVIHRTALLRKTGGTRNDGSIRSGSSSIR